MGVGRGWKMSFNSRIWILVGIFLVQGVLGELSNATEPDVAESESDVEVVSLVKKDKRQAQRGYTDVPLDQGPFDELIASSPSPIAFENDLPTFVDTLGELADATPSNYNTNKFLNYESSSDNEKGNTKGETPSERDQTKDSSNNPSGPGPSASPSSHQSVVIASNNLGPLINVSRPPSFFNQKQIAEALNNGVPFGPVITGTSGLSGPGITPTGPLTDSIALPDSTAAQAINIERRQATDIQVNINEPPPFNGKAIPGEAGIDYPIFGEIPKTSFSCKDHPWPGYYADTQARCQVFWICQKHRMDGFLCPNGTLFNQQVFVCDWWFNVDCSAAPEFYSRNQFVYAGPGIGIDGQPVRGLSLPIAATNRVSKVLPPLPPPSFNNAFLKAPSSLGSQVQSSNQIARVAPTSPARPTEFQTRADSLNNYLKSSQTTGGTGNSYQSQLVSRLQSNPNKLHESIKSTTLSPVKEYDRRIPSASSQISQSQVTSGTSRPITSNYPAQHVETVSIVTTPNPTTRSTTARPPPPPIPKHNISPTPKSIKGPSPSPFGNVIKLGTTVTISTTHRPDYSTKQSLFKGIISSTVKPSKLSGLKFSSTNLVSGTSPPTKYFSRPSAAPQLHHQQPPRPVSTEDPNNTVRPPDYSPQRAPDPSPSSFSAPGYLPSSRPNHYIENGGFGRESKQHQYFVSSTARPLSEGAHGMRSNQFSNVHGQRENIYASSRKDTFIEFPYSPSQQKNKQRLAELATRKDISNSKNVVTAIPHFYGQRSNVFSGTDSFSFINNNNKRVIIDHTNYSQRQGPFVKTSQRGQAQHENLYQGPSGPQHVNAHPVPPHLQHPSPQPSQQHFTNVAPTRATHGLIPPQQYTIQPQLQVSSKPEQRFIVSASPSPTPQQFQSSTSQYHQLALPHPSPTAHHNSGHHQHPQQHHQQQHPQHQQRPELTSSDAVTPRDGFTPLNAGSFISIQTTAPPFSQQILKHNSLQPQNPYEETRHGYSSTGPPPTPQQVIFSSPPTNNNNLGPFVSSTAAPRHFEHNPTHQPQHQNHYFSSTIQPPLVSSTASPYIDNRGTVTPKFALSTPTPYSTPNNFIAAPTQSPFYTTSPGHRQNPYLPHNHGKQKVKQQQRPASLSAVSPASFPQGGITTTIKYPEGTGKLRLDFSGGSTNNRRNIVDFTYSASPSSTPSTFVSSTTPYPASADRFTQAVSSTTIKPQTHSFPPPASSGRSSGGRYAGAVTNKSNLSSSAIYVDTAATAESVSTPVTVPSPSATTPSSASPLPPVSTSNYGLRLSATAKKRMTGAWQSYFSSKSE
ncbi:unnamed protein product [Orchesella dallaii]|uniref:Chitin-binding type-2 domain-containing protein n=1 Tax=Orchesella dallaii TaxID=48710 RepID=A0ABP1PRQ8_9HEXA